MTRTFADDQPVFIIGEAGSNWRMGTPARDMKMAKALIDVAAETGCDAVKFQTYRAETVYAPNAGRTEYLINSGNAEDIFDIFRDLSMPYEMLGELAAHSRQRKIEFMSSPFSVTDAKAVDPHVTVHKVASYEVNHRRLLEYVASTGKPLVLSTGAAELSEIGAALELLRANKSGPVCLLQCTAKYPAGLGDLNLRAIRTLREQFKVPVGFSDHSEDPIVGPTAAVALGARVVEKHYTLAKGLPGPDHTFAVEPDQLADMVRCIRGAEAARGDGKKVVQGAERELRAYAVRALQTLRAVKRGEAFVEGQNFDILRPGINRPGINPMRVTEVAGKKAARDLAAGEGIGETDFQ
jgi:N-acetylneuraminate synthase